MNNQNNQNDIKNEIENEILSKTKRKQMMDHLQKLGESLALLNDNQLKKISNLLPENLLNAIYELKRLIAKNVRSAKKRQIQFIGKIMRTIAPEIITIISNKIQNNISENHHSNNKNLNEKYVSQICENILNNDENYIFKFLNDFDFNDEQKRDLHFQLRTLKRNILKDFREKNSETNQEVNTNFANSKNYKTLFQIIKNIVKLSKVN